MIPFIPRFAYLIIVSLIFFSAPYPVQSGEVGDKTLFLFLEISQSSVKLVKTRVIPGKCKLLPVVKTHPILFEIMGEGDTPILKASLKNPLHIRYDLPDPQSPDKIKGGYEVKSKMPLTVRVPFNPQYRKIRFLKQPVPTGTSTNLNGPGSSLIFAEIPIPPSSEASPK